MNRKWGGLWTWTHVSTPIAGNILLWALSDEGIFEKALCILISWGNVSLNTLYINCSCDTSIL